MSNSTPLCVWGDTTESFVWHASCLCVTWVTTHGHMWHDASTRVTRRIHTCVMTHSYVCQSLRICAKRVYVRRDSFVLASWLIHMRKMPKSCMSWLIHVMTCLMHAPRESCIYTTWFIHLNAMPHSFISTPYSNVTWRDKFICSHM